ncbi:UNVERIFIED_CONTAM: hypothetical protein FKN15_002168 [Acipenser sinensis]
MLQNLLGFGFQSTRNVRAAKDMQIYRHGYPNLQENEENANKEMCNFLFYQNAFPSEPDGVTIEEFHSEWKTNYRKLERIHSYIQWLFPLREPGMNYRAYELTQKEIKKRFKRRNTPGEKRKEKGGGGGLSTCEVNQCEAAQPVLEKGEEMQQDVEPEKERKGETTQDLAESVDAERKDKGSSLEEGSSVDNELDNTQRCQDNNVQPAEGTSDASLNGDGNSKESKDEGLEEDSRKNNSKPNEDSANSGTRLPEASNNGETVTDDTGLKDSEPVDQADITDIQGNGTGCSEMPEMAAAKDNENGVQTDACVSEGTDEGPDCEQKSTETAESNPTVILGGSQESAGSVSQAQLSEDQSARIGELPNQTTNPGNEDTAEQEGLAKDTNTEVHGSHTHIGQGIGCTSEDVEMSNGDGDDGATSGKVETPSPMESDPIATNNEGACQDSDMECEMF